MVMAKKQPLLMRRRADKYNGSIGGVHIGYDVMANPNRQIQIAVVVVLSLTNMVTLRQYGRCNCSLSLDLEVCI